MNAAAMEAPTLPMDSKKAFDNQIEDELDSINRAVTEINRASGEVFRSKAKFRKQLENAKDKLDALYLDNKKSIEKARPYFKARAEMLKARDDLQRVHVEYKRCCLDFDDARENETVAERALQSCMSAGYGGTHDTDALSNLNKANERVYEERQRKNISSIARNQSANRLTNCENRAFNLHRELRKFINKSCEYYELRESSERELEQHVRVIRSHQRRLQDAKDNYRVAFEGLDKISTELEQRTCASDRNLSRFEEIDSIDDLDENLNLNKQNKVRSQSVESLRSMQSLQSIESDEFSLDSTIDHEDSLHQLRRSVSMNCSEEQVAQVVEEQHPKRGVSLKDRKSTDDGQVEDAADEKNYAVTFQMEL